MTHRCDDRCVCPIDSNPLIYWPGGDQHACVDPACVNAHGVKQTGPFRARMELGFDDCDPVATCHCGTRLKGDSVNDALIAWGKHLASVHRGEW